MFNISNIYRNVSVTSYLLQQARFKNKIHWAKLKKKTSPKYKALNHFDDFYGSVFGNKWPSMREALLRRPKYVAVVNNYGDAEETSEYLTNRGAHCLKKLISIQQEFHKQYTPEHAPENPTSIEQESHKINEFMAQQHTNEISNIYPKGDNVPERLEMHDEDHRQNEVIKNKDKFNLPTKTLDQSMAEAEIDTSRIIDPSLGNTNEALYQYIPATKLKGIDDWVPESLHYSYYSKDKDFPLSIEPEAELNFPEHLKVFTYEMDSESRDFPEPRRCQTGVYNYYPMDCGSVLSVLALNLTPGDRLLDLCSAPGGKALVALQTLLPDVVVCNDISISRSNRTPKKYFGSTIFDFETSTRVAGTCLYSNVRRSGYFIDDQGFDKTSVSTMSDTGNYMKVTFAFES
ncbi:unnamed protein product [Arctia plantaginis]|uniref:SAM-dependent MTase RsmB/NOP-type domain-containing protein n=1 Tax=Arctia plantaginis TaxID=874455 RepID=A0A8S0ZC72_ARCPL|nr:unnamed protein product [Arctia plantaginis]